MTARPTLTELLDDADFVGRHIGPTAEEQAEMLALLGVATVDELLDQTVPAAIRMTEALDLPGRAPSATCSASCAPLPARTSGAPA